MEPTPLAGSRRPACSRGGDEAVMPCRTFAHYEIPTDLAGRSFIERDEAWVRLPVKMT